MASACPARSRPAPGRTKVRGSPRRACLYFHYPHVEIRPSRRAIPAELPERIPLQIVTAVAAPPAGLGWLHEVKHDGHRLLAIAAAAGLRLVSRNGYDRTAMFRAPFEGLAGLPPLVLDGEIAVPDERGVTHIDPLTEAMRLRRPESLAYFAFDLLFLDGLDLRACAIEDRKALLRDIVGIAGLPRLVTVDHVVGNGAALFAAVRKLGAEGIVSKRAGSPYRGGTGRDWLKTKVSEEGAFVITGFVKSREAVAVAEMRDGVLVPAGMVKFGLGGKELWRRLEGLRSGPPTRSGLVPVRLELVAGVRYFGRYRTGAIRDGVLLRVG
jgi:bifunctional non-homologous end joining protein LigD